MRHKNTFLLLSLIILFGCKNDSANPIISKMTKDEKTNTAQKIFKEEISKVKFADFSVSSFEKINGYDQDFMGLKYYQLEFKAEIRSKTEVDFYYRGSMRMIEDYEVDFPKDADLLYPERASNPWFKGRSMVFKSGSPITLTGTITLQKTENGWRSAK